MKTRPRSSSSAPPFHLFVAITCRPSNSAKNVFVSSHTVARVPISHHKTSVVPFASILPWTFYRGFHKTLAVNRRNRESCPRGKGTTSMMRRSGEEGGKRTQRGTTRRGWLENRDGGPRRKILAINYYATSRRSKLLLVLHWQ